VIARFKTPVYALVDLILALPLLLLSIASRLANRRFDVGLGPEPFLNHVHHKKALEHCGYKARTFVNHLYYITDEFDLRLSFRRPFNYLTHHILFALSLFSCRSLYISFKGGSLGSTVLLWRFEPLFYRLAAIRIVVMPYGADVQDLSRTPNLLFRHAVGRDYPRHRFLRARTVSKIDLWTRHADHVIAGCEWVNYLYHWDTLTLGHFAIDTDLWKRTTASRLPADQKEPIRILHAPNHRHIKGTEHFVRAVEELKQEGMSIELIVLERVPNSEIRRAIAAADLVADQLVMGWYALFAIEAMAMEKPVLCHIREDLRNFYVAAGLIEEDELPLIDCSPGTLKETIREIALKPDELPALGRKGREFVIRHHSLESVGAILDRINRSLGIRPSAV
jgi:glycosyltransferase involved in cell wall biosynthesis